MLRVQRGVRGSEGVARRRERRGAGGRASAGSAAGERVARCAEPQPYSVGSGPLLALVLLDEVEQLKDGKAKRIRDDLNGIERRVGPPVLDATQVGLVDAAALAEHHLAHAGLLAQIADT